MPDDVAAEKAQALRCLGADIEQVRPASIVDKKQVSEPKTLCHSLTLTVCINSLLYVEIEMCNW
jgi:hypothetical protein